MNIEGRALLSVRAVVNFPQRFSSALDATPHSALQT